MKLCHIRRRDNLTSAIHMIVEAVFWFHPLVWWIGRAGGRTGEGLRRRSIGFGNEPQVYAEAILMCASCMWNRRWHACLELRARISRRGLRRL